MDQWSKRRKAKELQESGIWTDVIVDGKEWRFHVRSSTSSAFQNANTRIMDPIRAKYKKAIPSDKMNAALIRLLAEGAIIGWEGVTGPDGLPLHFSAEAAVEVLELFPEVRDAVSAVSTEYAAYLAEAEESARGN